MITLFPKILQKCTPADIPALSLELRRYHSKMRPPKVSLIEITADIGMTLMRNSKTDSLFVRDNAHSITAELHLKSKNPWEEQFALAHLLSHFFLHAAPKLESGRLTQLEFHENEDPFERFRKKNYQNSQDRQADQLACEILIPSSMLAKTKTKMQDLASIAEFFNVHPYMVVNPEPAEEPRHSAELRSSKDPLSRLRALARKIDQSVKP